MVNPASKYFPLILRSYFWYLLFELKMDFTQKLQLRKRIISLMSRSSSITRSVRKVLIEYTLSGGTLTFILVS